MGPTCQRPRLHNDALHAAIIRIKYEVDETCRDHLYHQRRRDPLTSMPPHATPDHTRTDLYPRGALAVDGGLRSDQVTTTADPEQNSEVAVAVMEILSGGYQVYRSGGVRLW
ncbi:MAG: hypothetical protein ACRDPO_17525 [Streptosporangiaceae bacterium]